MAWKTNDYGGIFNTDWNNKERQITENKKQAQKRQEDEFDEEMKHDNIRDDYEPRKRDNTPRTQLPDKDINNLKKRLDTISNANRINTNSLRKLQNEIEALRKSTGDNRLDKLLSNIKGLWNELR